MPTPVPRCLARSVGEGQRFLNYIRLQLYQDSETQHRVGAIRGGRCCRTIGSGAATKSALYGRRGFLAGQNLLLPEVFRFMWSDSHVLKQSNPKMGRNFVVNALNRGGGSTSRSMAGV